MQSSAGSGFAGEATVATAAVKRNLHEGKKSLVLHYIAEFVNIFNAAA